jgi:hypothetical protein
MTGQAPTWIERDICSPGLMKSTFKGYKAKSLKATDEKSRIRIRIRKSVIRIRGSGSAPKGHGSTTTFFSIDCTLPPYLERTRYLFSRTSINRPGVAMTISQPSLSLKPCSSRERPPMTATVRMPSGSPNLFASSSICWASSLVDHKQVFRIQNIFQHRVKYMELDLPKVI